MITSTKDIGHTIPLLLSVRSGGPVYVPGMAETVLSLGLNDNLCEVMAKLSRNPHWAYDNYRCFIQMFGVSVLHIPKQRYLDVIQAAMMKSCVSDETYLTTVDIQLIVKEFQTFTPIPENPWDQLAMAISAFFQSWNSPEARQYRDVHGISQDLGTGIIVQSMVYGKRASSKMLLASLLNMTSIHSQGR